MISLSECAPCKAMRLQAESEAEFRKRFGVVNARPAMKGWRPYLGQATAVYPAAGAAPAATSPYLEQTKQRLLFFAGRGVIAFPIGILINVAFTSLRRHRSEAVKFAAISAAVGLTAAVLPWESKILDLISGLAGTLTGLGAAKMALPKKREEAINVVPI